MENTSVNKIPLLIEELGVIKKITKNGNIDYKKYGIYQCPYCKNNFKSEHRTIISGRATECKSCAAKISSTTHGLRKHKLYSIYDAIKQRINNINNKNYKYYGGRGISIFEEWENDFIIFFDWAMLNGYQEGLTIDRIDNNGNYEPSNCRWVDMKVQSRNTRLLISTNTSGYRGVCFDKSKNKYISKITVNYKYIFLGYFDNKIDAAKAYDNYVIINNLEHTRNFN